MANVNVVGNSLNNLLSGNAGNNYINGNAGADTMRGLGGNDTYIVDNAGDIVDESVAGSGGTDTVFMSLSVNLSDAVHFRGDIENVALTGAADVNLVGNGLNNILNGNAGNNYINGNASTDTMRGRAGNDTYIVDNAGDIINESMTRLGRKPSKYFSSLSVNLSDAAHFRGDIENVVLTGAADVNVVGNGLEQHPQRQCRRQLTSTAMPAPTRCADQRRKRHLRSSTMSATSSTKPPPRLGRNRHRLLEPERQPVRRSPFPAATSKMSP